MPQLINKAETSRPRPNSTSTTFKADEEGWEEMTHYSLLGVEEDATEEELKIAFRQRALLEHPDKGGDADRFHELQMAFNVLENQERRDAYDEELRQARERAELVEGARSRKPTNTPAREKTAPTPGSKRSKKMEGQVGGNPEWKIHGSGRGILKAIEDDASAEAKAQLLFNKYQALPRNKEKKRDWLDGVRGEEKKALKACAKDHEKKQMEKWSKWLAPGAQAVPAGRSRGLVQRASPGKAKCHADYARSPVAAPEAGPEAGQEASPETVS